MAEQVQPESSTAPEVPALSVHHEVTVASSISGTVTGTNPITASGVPIINLITLYVGDLDFGIIDSQLEEKFKPFGDFVSVRVCSDLVSPKPRCYGYVNFSKRESALNAMKALNLTYLNGKAMRIMFSDPEKDAQRNQAGNIFIKNLERAIEPRILFEVFSRFGTVVSCKVATDDQGISMGYGFVQYDNAESARNAIAEMNGAKMNDLKLYVAPFKSKEERKNTTTTTDFTNLYVKNLGDSVTDENLNLIFREYGKITSAVVMKDGNGKSKGFGFVNFQNADDATKAVAVLNGMKFGDGEKEWYVGKAQKKAEREAELKVQFGEKPQHEQGTNLYLKNLDESIDDEKLKEIFSPYGKITSTKVMRHPSGYTAGSGSVAFETVVEASSAIEKMNGQMVGSKPLYVALWQNKEERKNSQTLFSPTGMQQPTVNPQIGVFPQTPSTPPPPLVYYNQPPANVIPGQPGFGFQPQFGFQPRMIPYPNFYIPVARPGQSHDQRPYGWRSPPGPNMMRRGHFQFPDNQRGAAPHIQRRAAPEIQLPTQIHEGYIGAAVSSDLASLPSLPPETQTYVLGQNLFPLVEQIEPEMAPKVTGMLLEMDQTEILHLLEAPDALQAKVAEAMNVLRGQGNIAADLLGGLSLEDN